MNRSLEKIQTAWLQRCLRRNADTAFGRAHEFDAIDSPQEYKLRVPLQDYEGLRPWIERHARGETDVLFAGRALAFERTGGSTGGAKLIPYSGVGLEDFRRALLPWFNRLVDHYRLGDHQAYWSISPATRGEERTAGGIPIGLPDAAYLGGQSLQTFAALSAAPAWLAELEGMEEWRLATLYWLLRQEGLALISVWSPTFFLALLDGLESKADALRHALGEGTTLAGHWLPPDLRALERFDGYLEHQDTRRLWSNLRLISCWMDGPSAHYAERLRERLPQAHFQGKGLLSTESVVTAPNHAGEPLLAVESGFFEFLPFSDATGSDTATQYAWQLNPGERYEVAVTTNSGLYRYRTGDLVRCEGMRQRLPVLRFQGRADLVSDLVGEKLAETFVVNCLNGLPGFWVLVAEAAPSPRYLLVAEARYADRIGPRLEEIDRRLAANPQYAYARELGQLAPLGVSYQEAPLTRYLEHCAASQRLGDVKIPALLPAHRAPAFLRDTDS